MRTVIPFLLIALLAAASLHAQTEKSITPLPSTAGRPPSTVTRAVVVGISDYQDPQIPDLRFADRDAEAFANFLRSPAGGSLDNEHLKVLTNQKATAGNIIAALTGLVEGSKPGDRAIISFSGHGDIEQVTKSLWGYLLCHDSPPKVYPAGGTVPLPYLQEIITTLSEAGVKVLIVSDACHAGKLAGSSRGGSKAATSGLMQQFSNEVKILSCQPEEFSLEGEEWGGGRGCFSFHLLNALVGDSDANADGLVNLLEVDRYLEDKVPAAAAPQSQIPMTVGNRSTVLANVHAPSLEAFREAKVSTHALSIGSMKGMEDALLEDSVLQELYRQFVAALESGHLLDSSGNSANDLYLRLLREPELSKLHGAMTRNLAAALQNQAQIVINQILATDPQIVDDAFSPVSSYDHLPAYLARAAELLGEKHYMYRFLKAREYFFRSKTLRVENYPGIPADSLLHRQLACLDTALTFDSEAAYLYFEKGYLQYWGMKQSPDLCRANLEKAVKASPEWVLPLYFLGRQTANDMHDPVNGIPLLERARELDSTFLPIYRELSFSTSGQQSKYWLEKYIQEMQNYESRNPDRMPVTYLLYLGNILWRHGRNEEAKAALVRGLELSDGKFPLIYRALGVVYCSLGEYELAEQNAIKLIELSPLISEGFTQLVRYRLFFLKKNIETVPGLCRRGIALGDMYLNIELIMYYQRQGQLDSAFLASYEWLEKDSTNLDAMLMLAETLLLQGKKDEAKYWFEKRLDFEPDYSNHLSVLLQMNQTDESEKSLWKFVESELMKSDDPPKFCFYTAICLACYGRPNAALDWLEKALQLGWKPGPSFWVYPTLFNPDLDSIRDTRRFKKMVKKYLPEQAKIMKIN